MKLMQLDEMISLQLSGLENLKFRVSLFIFVSEMGGECSTNRGEEKCI
jgi:hypothetical protein